VTHATDAGGVELLTIQGRLRPICNIGDWQTPLRNWDADANRNVCGWRVPSLVIHGLTRGPAVTHATDADVGELLTIQCRAWGLRSISNGGNWHLAPPFTPNSTLTPAATPGQKSSTEPIQGSRIQLFTFRTEGQCPNVTLAAQQAER
jgi:hypothetical protein